MEASIKIMGIDVDMLSNDVFISKINEYLTEEKLHVILFASTELLNRTVEDEEYRKMIDDMAQLFLPGEEALLSAHHADVLKAGGMVVSWKSLGVVLEKLQKEDRSIYIVSRSARNIELLTGYCKRMQPELRIVGSYVYEEEQDEALVNEINSRIPDILLLDLPTGQQEEWITAHALLMNVKLCIALGGVAGLIIAQEKQIPRWVKNLHLSRLYHVLVREQSVKKDVKARIFRKKVVNYKDDTRDNRS